MTRRAMEMPGRWKAGKTKSMISTFPSALRKRPWKSGKPKPGFPLSHTRFAITTTVSFFKTRRGGRSFCCSNRLPKAEFSGSSTIGNRCQFQAHVVLESNLDFRLIFGLENACHFDHHFESGSSCEWLSVGYPFRSLNLI